MNTSKKVVGLLLVVIVLVLLNIAGGFLSFKIDMTEEKLYTLSEGSQALVENIEEPVAFEFYYSKSIEGLPVYFKNFATRVEEMLKQYEAASNGMITLNVIDPKPDTKDEERAARAGVQGQMMPSGEQLYFGLAVIQVENQENVPVFDPQRERFIEYDISKALYAVQQIDKPIIGVYTGLKMFTEFDMQTRQPIQQDWAVIQTWKNNFEVRELNSLEEISEDIDILAVIHPAGATPEYEYAIDQFIMTGKPTFIAVDPTSLYVQRNSQSPQYMYQPNPNVTSQLSTLFEHYGIGYDAAQLVADKKFALQVGSGQSQSPITYPIWAAVQKESFDTDFLPTAELGNMAFIEFGGLTVVEDSPLKMTPVIQTSTEAGFLESGSLRMMRPEDLMKKVETQEERIALAALYQGPLTTAFPEGRPKAPESAEGEEASESEPEAEAAPTLKESTGDVNVFVITDTDWMQNQYSIQELNFLGIRQLQPINDNIYFASNIIEFLSGSNDLISIRGAGVSLRSFELVEEIQEKAQKKYQEALAKLDEEIQQIQAELNELNQGRSDQGSLTLNAEMEAAVAEFNARETELRSERREIRKKAREDVETLERNMLLANMLVVPSLVGLFGIVFFMKRNRN